MNIEERARNYATHVHLFLGPVVNTEEEGAYWNGATDQKKIAEVELKRFTQWVLKEFGHSDVNAEYLIREYRKNKIQ